ncbi:MAG: hypothetical protein ACXWV5_02520 [Flavitalea sp.]
MNNKFCSGLVICLSLIICGCTKDSIVNESSQKTIRVSLLQAQKAALKNSAGATQVQGIGYYATVAECPLIDGATYAVKMTGDLEGCLFVFVDDFGCSPSGTYREAGREYFVGTYNGKSGSFWTDYKFEAKYEGCAENGAPLGAEIFGRCQHPVIKGSGEGDFEGVTGRLDFKDDIEAGNFPYRGHLQF